MSPVYIKTRTAKSGKRYLVYYRRGGRGFPEEYAGSFKTQKEARARSEFVAGELAAGRDPRAALEQLRTPPAPKRGLQLRWDDFIASRLDVGEKSISSYRNSRDRWVPILGAGRDPATVTALDIAAGVAELYDGGEGLAPATITHYHSTLRQVLEFCDVEPNPADSKKVKLPQGTKAEKAIPSNEAWAAIVPHVKKRSRAVLEAMEACGFRVSEATQLELGDIDFLEGQAHVRRAATKTASGRRWVPVPPEILDEILERIPPDDRTAHRRAYDVTSQAVYDDLTGACAKAGVPEYGTHALRHRRISLLLRHGIDAVQVSRWSGHAKPSESTDTYGHVVVDPAGDRWREFWLAAYAAGRAPGAAPVRHEQVEEA